MLKVISILSREIQQQKTVNKIMIKKSGWILPKAKLPFYIWLSSTLGASVVSQTASKDRRSSSLMGNLGSYAIRKNFNYKKIRLLVIEKLQQEKIAKRKLVKKLKRKSLNLTHAYLLAISQ
ncbi:hypothetical protein IQ277_07805 [Nostocales cyanobacterium LEGE 12452]|nr:hypothetical protein [Nostocales cyanobacterium LEGE 12452]